MMNVLIGLVLLCQTLSVHQAYTAVTDNGQFELVTTDGRMTIQLGNGCDAITPWMNVEWLAGSGDVGAIQPLDSDQLCSIGIDEFIDPIGCYANTDGICDVSLDPGRNS